MVIVQMGNMRAGRPKWLKAPRQVPITFESQELEDFKESLPKGVSLSEAIRELVKVQVDETKKGEAPDRVSIIASPSIRQTTISEYDIKLLQDPKERMQNLTHLTKQQQIKIAEDVLFLQQQIRAARK